MGQLGIYNILASRNKPRIFFQKQTANKRPLARSFNKHRTNRNAHTNTPYLRTWHLHPYAVTDHYPTITAAYKGINITIEHLSRSRTSRKNLKPKRGDT